MTDRFSDSTIMTFTGAYGILFIIGFLANVATCVTMVQRRLQKPIDVYTFNLCLCDIIMIVIYIPTQVIFIREHFIWTMGEEVCKLVNSVLPVALMCTIATLVALNLHCVLELLRYPDFIASEDDRKHSFITRVLSTKFVQEKWKVPPAAVMLASWVSSVTVSLPLIINSELNVLNQCREGWEYPRQGDIYWVTLFALTYCAPVAILVISYGTLMQSMNKIQKVKEFSRYTRTVNVGMLLTGTFAVCTLPQHIFFFITCTFSRLEVAIDVQKRFFVLSNMLVILQAVLNPFIYGKFRRLLLRKKQKDKKRNKKTKEQKLRSKRRPLLEGQSGWHSVDLR